MANSNLTGSCDSSEFRARLGMRLVFWSSLALVTLAALVMIGATITATQTKDSEAVFRAAQLLFSSLLPLFGIWVGTILAFYYTKENYDAATQSTLDVMKTVDQRLRTTNVAENMIPRGKIISETIPSGGKIGDVRLAAVATHFQTVGANGLKISRLLFLDAAGACVAILHRSVWAELLADGLQETTPVDIKSDKLERFLIKPYASPVGSTYEDFVTKTIAVVGFDRSVADAKAAMEASPGCQDVIVTQNGIRACPHLSQASAQTRCKPARKLRAVFS